MIRFDSVAKTYPDGTTALDGLNLEAPSGAITVLVGPSGCGKTTALRMINRMVTPTRGQVRLDGRDVADLDPGELRRGIGYVIQSGGLFPHRTVLDNVASVPVLLGVKRRVARAQAAQLLARVGLDPELGARYPNQLSGGQQQRVGVARALAADPPVMLMDEPFSAVDPVVRAQLHEEFLRLQSELGKTIVFVTHDIDEAITLGDHIAVLRVGGTVAQMGSPAQLLSDPADDFVADFIGRDRGYRALGLRQAPDLAVRNEPTVPLGTSARDVHLLAPGQRWVLVVDQARAPLGWIDSTRLTAPITAADLHRGGTLATQGGSLRAALDAALSSPSGLGVIVDEAGAVAGTISPERVLDGINTARGSQP